jgi:hypothetical protein
MLHITLLLEGEILFLGHAWDLRIVDGLRWHGGG